VLRFNMQFKSGLNQLSLSHESNNKAKRRETKQKKTDKLINNNNNNLRLIMVKTNHSTLHTVYNI